jgi:hypothetical protein
VGIAVLFVKTSANIGIRVYTQKLFKLCFEWNWWNWDWNHICLLFHVIYKLNNKFYRCWNMNVLLLLKNCRPVSCTFRILMMYVFFQRYKYLIKKIFYNLFHTLFQSNPYEQCFIPISNLFLLINLGFFCNIWHKIQIIINWILIAKTTN